MTTLAQKSSRNSELRHWSYYFNKSGEFYIVGEGENLAFTDIELDTVIEMWREGRHITDIVDTLKRTEFAVTMLIMELSIKGRIEGRPGGALGEVL